MSHQYSSPFGKPCRDHSHSPLACRRPNCSAGRGLGDIARETGRDGFIAYARRRGQRHARASSTARRNARDGLRGCRQGYRRDSSIAGRRADSPSCLGDHLNRSSRRQQDLPQAKKRYVATQTVRGSSPEGTCGHRGQLSPHFYQRLFQ